MHSAPQTRPSSLRLTRLTIALLAAFALSACGGGSKGGTRPDGEGGGTPTGPVITDPPAQGGDTGGGAPVTAPSVRDFDTAEYRRGGFLAQIGAAEAYVAGGAKPASGAGITIAVVDTGIATDHPELAGRIAPGGRMFGFSDSQAIFDHSGHGTAVAGVIAAQRNQQGVHGVAWGASVLPIGAAPGLLPETTYGEMFTHAHAMGARVINNSWTMKIDIDTFRSRTEIEDFLPDTIESLIRYTDAGGVVVFAAGNEGAARPQFWARLPEQIEELQGNWVTAVALDSNGQLAAYSNACGNSLSAAWCIAAPGGSTGSPIVTLHPDSRTTGLIGTSMAAPVVSGAIAVLMELFPTLGGDQIVQRIFATADRSGDYARTGLYGNGRLDLAAAARPVGGLLLPVGASVNGPAAAIGSTSVSVPEAQLATLRKTLAAQDVVVVDAFQRAPFRISAADLLVGANAPRETLARRVSRRHGDAAASTHLTTVSVTGGAVTAGAPEQVQLMVGVGAAETELDRLHGFHSWSGLELGTLASASEVWQGNGANPGLGLAFQRGDWMLSAYGEVGDGGTGGLSESPYAVSARLSRRMGDLALALGFDRSVGSSTVVQSSGSDSDIQSVARLAVQWQPNARWASFVDMRLHQQDGKQRTSSVQAKHETTRARLTLGTAHRLGDRGYTVGTQFSIEPSTHSKLRMSLPVSVGTDGTLVRRDLVASARDEVAHGVGAFFSGDFGAARTDKISLAASWHSQQGGELTAGWQRRF